MHLNGTNRSAPAASPAALSPDSERPAGRPSDDRYGRLRARRSTSRRLLLRPGGALVRRGRSGALGARPKRVFADVVENDRSRNGASANGNGRSAG